MARIISLFLVIVAGVCLGNASATSAKAHAKRVQRWSWFWNWNTAPATKPSLRPPPKRLEDTKMALMASAVFTKQASSECLAASEDQKQGCEHAAGGRLFCAMFS